MGRHEHAHALLTPDNLDGHLPLLPSRRICVGGACRGGFTRALQVLCAHDVAEHALSQVRMNVIAAVVEELAEDDAVVAFRVVKVVDNQRGPRRAACARRSIVR